MGKSITYNIVSHADTVIVLRNPCIVFAEWGPPVPSSTSETEGATRGRHPLAILPVSKKGKKKLKKPLRTSPDDPVVNDGRLAPLETSPADNGGSSSSAIFPTESSKETEQSIFGPRLSGTKQAVPISETVEPGESKTSDDLSSAIVIDTNESEAVYKSTTENEEEEGIRFEVCAGNLMSASPWFSRA
jgi:hypothetical protein